MSLKVRGILVLMVGTLLGLSLSLGGGVLAHRDDRLPQRQDTVVIPAEDARLLAEVLERVRRDYVDAVDERQLVENAIKGIVGGLDTYSQFLDPAAYEEIRISTTGNYSGVGLELSADHDQVTVVTPLDHSPAQAAGILPGDVLLSIDNVPARAQNLNEAIARMRGEPGSQVALAIRRQGREAPLSFQLTRRRISVSSVKSQYLGDGEGYLRITHFSDTTAADVQSSVEKMKQAAGGRLDGLVMDLRNNPGGVLDAAVDVADAFLDEGLIVRGDGRISEARFARYAHPGDAMQGGKIVILVNSGSASASEIVAGALKDQGRATLLGITTYGKGSVQTVMPLSGGRAIKLTTARYFTPSGASIHERGIDPDVVVQQPLVDGRAQFGPEHMDGDYQLRQALQWLHRHSAVHRGTGGAVATAPAPAANAS